MRWDISTNGIKLNEEYLKDLLGAIDYKLMEKESTYETLSFRNNNFHLIVSPKKTRVSFRLHKDTFYFGRHGHPIFNDKSIGNEQKKIDKHMKSYERPKDIKSPFH